MSIPKYLPVVLNVMSWIVFKLGVLLFLLKKHSLKLIFLFVWPPTAAGMGSRGLWRTSTVSPTILSTSWRFSVQQGALLFGCCSPDTSLIRSGHPDRATPSFICISVKPVVYNLIRIFWCNLTTMCLFTQDDFAQNREFITLVVYKTDGKKVYYPGDVWCWNFFCLTELCRRFTSAVCHAFISALQSHSKVRCPEETLVY